MEEIGGRTQGWENLQERTKLSPILRAVPRGEIILGVLDMPGTPQKPMWAANRQISPETCKNCQKETNETQTLPTHSHYVRRKFFLEGDEGNMEEIGGRTQGWENLQERAKLSPILRAVPRGEIILGVLDMPGTPQKPMWAANRQISPETCKNCQKTDETQTLPTRSHYVQRKLFWKEMKGIWKK